MNTIDTNKLLDELQELSIHFPETFRDNFEQAVFKRYSISQISNDMKLNSDTKGLAELCAKDSNGEYLDKDISAMWFGYNIDKRQL